MERYDPVKSDHKVVCIKIGGKAATDEPAMKALIGEMSAMSTESAFVLIHGGGGEVTRLSEILGYVPTFSNGIRMTSPEEMDVVDMVLAGKMNKGLVRRFHAAGMRAAGLCGADGSLFTGTPLNEHTHTGRIQRVDSELLRLLIGHSYLPVIASVSMTETGIPLNINADEAAFAVAAALPADVLVFLSDIPGVLAGNGDRIAELDEKAVSEKIADGTITGGMIPKVGASLEALRAGVGTIVVGRYASAGDLHRLLRGTTGTRVVLASPRNEHSPKR